MNSTKKTKTLSKEPVAVFLGKCLAVLTFIMWVMLSQGCATGLGDGDVKLREYMKEGISFTVESGAYENTQ